MSVGTLAWSVWLFGAIQSVIEHGKIDEVGIIGSYVFGRALLLIYWLGTLLQVQKHCLTLKLKKRKEEKTHAK